MTHSDETLDFLEEQIPLLAQSALTVAYWEALSAGLSVLQVEEGNLVEVFPNGSRRVIKAIEEGVSMPKGTRFSLDAER